MVIGSCWACTFLKPIRHSLRRFRLCLATLYDSGRYWEVLSSHSEVMQNLGLKAMSMKYDFVSLMAEDCKSSALSP